MAASSDTKPLLSDPNGAYGTTENVVDHVDDPDDDDDDVDSHFKPLKDKTWSFSHRQRVSVQDSPSVPSVAAQRTEDMSKRGGFKGVSHYLFCLIYAIVNVIVAAPALYGCTCRTKFPLLY